MADLYDILKPESKYYDRKNYSSQQQYDLALSTSSTVYIGNLSFFTTQDAIKELFGRAGTIKQIIMGIDNQGNPCGFCFVEYQRHQQAELAVQYISKASLNERIIRVDWDPGYKEGRQKGRGSNGQQRRDDFRSKEDVQRPKKKVNTGNSNGYQRGGSRDYRGDNRGNYRDSRDNSRGHYRGERRQYRGDRNDYRDRGDRDRHSYRDKSDRGWDRDDYRHQRTDKTREPPTTGRQQRQQDY